MVGEARKVVVTNRCVTNNIICYRIIWQLQQIHSYQCTELCKRICADLNVVAVVDGWVEVGKDEVGVVGEPADEEQGHDPHHHLHHLI